MSDQREREQVAIPTDEEIRAALEVCEKAMSEPWANLAEDEAFIDSASTGYPRALRAVQELKRRLAEAEADIKRGDAQLSTFLASGECASTEEGTCGRMLYLERKLHASEKALGNLLAVIHRDGGHYLAEHGLEKAVEDAMAKWAEMRKALDELRHQPKEKT